MPLYLTLALLFRVACYLGVGALFYVLLIGNNFDWGSMIMWSFLLAWPVMIMFAIVGAVGVIGIVGVLIFVVVVMALSYRDKIRARRRRRNHLKIRESWVSKS